jgi:hypothetical protein
MDNRVLRIFRGNVMVNLLVTITVFLDGVGFAAEPPPKDGGSDNEQANDAGRHNYLAVAEAGAAVAGAVGAAVVAAGGFVLMNPRTTV